MFGREKKPAAAPTPEPVPEGRDYTKLPDREPLPESLQKILDKADKDESLYDELWDGT